MERYNSYKDSGVKWLGEIPSHWEMLALKHILKLKKDIVGRRSSQYDLLSLTLKGVVKRDMENPEGKFPASFDTYQAVEPNDFIFCNFDNEETPRAVGLSPYKGMITGAYDVLSRKNPKLTDGFLIYYFLYIDDAKRFKPLYKGLRKTVPFDSFMSYKIPVPSLKEQAAIVSYLDTATAKIDAAIAQQQKMIDLLNERKQIIINRAVTKGLNPNTKMKDSGVEWIGEVPEDWEVLALKYILRPKKKLVGRNSKNYDLLSLSLKGIIKRDMDNPDGKWPASFDTYQEVLPGDFVFCNFDNEETPRAVGLSSYKGMITGAYDVMCCFNENVDAQYLLYYLLYIDNSKRFKPLYKGLRKTVPIDSLMAYKIPVPSMKEQVELVNRLVSQTKKIDEIIQSISNQISLLQERKQIIINEVVTGKLKLN